MGILISELLDPEPSRTWTLVKQVGVDHVVAILRGAEQQARWLRGASTGAAPLPYQVPPRGERPWERPALEALQQEYAQVGLTIAAVEDTAPMDLVRLGLPGRDEQIAHVLDQVRAMGECGIQVLCYNWMAVGSWARTATEVPLRGGALSTGFDRAVSDAAGPLVAPGEVTEDQLWGALRYFLDAVVPVAEAAGVRLGLHPDDPPLESVRGVPRIIRSIDAYRRVFDLVDSPANGITLCQGNVTLMTEDLPAVIREFGSRDRIQFVHFRDVIGAADAFVEVFHDEGQTDMAECMRAYRDVGFHGPLRPDHVPTLAGEDNGRPGYAVLGRLFAFGYIRGLQQAVYSETQEASS